MTHVETNQANQWTDFYMIVTSVQKELKYAGVEKPPCESTRYSSLAHV